ncbi:hypothetical protein METESE_12170 [Mesoterricola sediminis]|uniref:DUF4177 domain-containing protein n=2 Tax=Mesoterricola sediminis TaxID=2927980 RepID=A0AA48GU52_9BACT|nr:hypothetical protein METESE_12170 [Mesoterricola sediminis]
MPKYEHQAVALKIKDKVLAFTRKDILSGISEESSEVLDGLGNDGWEMVAAIPFSSGSGGLLSGPMRTDCVLAFFKRQV